MKKISLIISVVLLISLFTQSIFAAENLETAEKASQYKVKAETFMKETDLSVENKAIVMQQLSLEAMAFLNDNEVAFDSKNEVVLNALEKLCEEDSTLDGLNERILSLKEDTEVYEFSKEQVQKYVKGLVTTKPIVARSKEDALQQASISGPVSSRTLDQQGAGYEVKSKPGYFKSTSYATLPTFSNFYNYSERAYRTAGYMMFTVSVEGKSPLDIGLSYSKGNSNNESPRFYVCYYDPTNASTNPNDAGGVAKFKEYYTNTTLSQGQNVYVKVEKYNSGSKAGYVNFSVVNATDFSTVYASLDYYIGDRFTESSGVINRQITLCDQSEQFNNGTQMNNAMFWNSWIYASSGYNSAPNSTNTESSRRGAFLDYKSRTTVNVNWYSAWNEESVSLSF